MRKKKRTTDSYVEKQGRIEHRPLFVENVVQWCTGEFNDCAWYVVVCRPSIESRTVVPEFFLKKKKKKKKTTFPAIGPNSTCAKPPTN